MNNPRAQLNHGADSIEPLFGALMEALLPLRNLLNVCEETLPRLMADRDSPCTLCERKEGCSKTCEKVETLLQRANSRRSRRENLTGFRESTLQDIKETRDWDIFYQFEACRSIFTRKQWKVVCLYWRDGKTQKKIAKELGKAVSTVNGHLKKAGKRKADHDRRLRAERTEILRKISHTEP